MIDDWSFTLLANCSLLPVSPPQDIKPSTLEYRSIPSTKVSINSLDAKATLDVSVKCTPDYPYISFLNISLVEIPAFSLRIEPQNER
jgi:Ca2+-dependent lipid-binding protein